MRTSPLQIPRGLAKDPGRECNEGGVPAGDAVTRREMDDFRQLLERLLPREEEIRSHKTTVPFTKELAEAKLPKGFTLPKFRKYDGFGDPRSHLKSFVNRMQYNTQDERAYARAFPQSLEGAAAGWFDDLPTDSVDSWHTLSRLFTERHGVGLTYEKNETELM